MSLPSDPGGTRTCNPRLRGSMPYPLGHGTNCVHQRHDYGPMWIYLNAPRIPQSHFLLKRWVLAVRCPVAWVPCCLGHLCPGGSVALCVAGSVALLHTCFDNSFAFVGLLASCLVRRAHQKDKSERPRRLPCVPACARSRDICSAIALRGSLPVQMALPGKQRGLQRVALEHWDIARHQ